MHATNCMLLLHNEGLLHALMTTTNAQARFPSWCAGPCGCAGPNATKPDAWEPTLSDAGAVTGGSLSCPDSAVDEARLSALLQRT